MTITFSEAVTNFNNADITAGKRHAHGGQQQSDGGVTWTGTFTPTDDIEDATNVITVGTALTIWPVTRPIASTTSANYSIDTKESR